MKLEIAEQYAAQVTNALQGLYERILVVGSIRRRRPEVNDIDIVLIPDYSDYRIPDALHFTTGIVRLEPEKTWFQNIPKVLKEKLKMKLKMGGPELLRFELFEDPDFLQVDIYRATPETWGVLSLVRTGSKEHNIMLCARAKRLGLMLSAKQGVLQDDKIIANRTEEEIFKALGLEFVAPEQREA